MSCSVHNLVLLCFLTHMIYLVETFLTEYEGLRMDMGFQLIKSVSLALKLNGGEMQNTRAGFEEPCEFVKKASCLDVNLMVMKSEPAWQCYLGGHTKRHGHRTLCRIHDLYGELISWGIDAACGVLN